MPSNQPVFLVSRADENARYPGPGVALEPRARPRPAAAAGRSTATSRRRSGRSSPTAPTCWRAGPTTGASASASTRAARTAIYFVDVLAPASGGLVEIANLPRAGRDARVARRRGRVEAALVYPVLRGRDVSRWRAEPAGHVFAPYRQDAMGTPLDRLRRGVPARTPLAVRLSRRSSSGAGSSPRSGGTSRRRLVPAHGHRAHDRRALRRRPRAGPAARRGRRAPARRRAPRPPRDRPDRPQAPVLRRRRPRTRRTTWRR